MHGKSVELKLLSKIQKEDPSAARKGLYQRIFNFSLGLQRPAERKWESRWVTSGLSANGWAVTQGSSQGPFWRCTQDKITLSVWINSSCGQQSVPSCVLLQLNHRKNRHGTRLSFLICAKNSKWNTFMCNILLFRTRSGGTRSVWQREGKLFASGVLHCVLFISVLSQRARENQLEINPL